MRVAFLLVLTLCLGNVACGQEPVRLQVTIPERALPILVLEGVEVPADTGLRLTVQALGYQLGYASLVGSSPASSSSSSRTVIQQLIVPLTPEGAQALANRNAVQLTLSAVKTADRQPAFLKVERAYFRTEARR